MRLRLLGAAVLAAATFFVVPPALATAAAPTSVTLAASFDSELGCAGDWNTTCSQAQLSLQSDGTWSRTLALPAGSWEYKVAINGSWDENYGAGGVAGGANIALTVAAGGQSLTFVYDPATHLVSSSAAAAATDALGAVYSSASTTFGLWSPDSADVSVTVAGVTRAMTATSGGIYQTVVAGDLNGQAYQFKVGGVDVRDPYARMVNPGTTQGVVVSDVLPSAGSWAPAPALVNRTDAVIYELGVRDYTIDASSGVSAAKRGKFLGLVQTGTTYNGVKTGIDHLKELGVTHVQIMPAYDFGSTVPNWGYDPVNFNVPEEQYSQFTAPLDRIREFEDMVDGFHRNGIRVILDVVYNHTISKDVFQAITGKYYTAGDWSGVGNSIDASQPMVSRMIRDSLEHWVRDYHVDGFRFDLAGVFRHADVAGWANYLNATYPGRNLLLYGEPWIGGSGQSPESDYVRYGTTASMQASHFGVFNGAFRDAIRGGTRDTVMGYMGSGTNPSAVALGLRGSPLATLGTGVLANLWDPAFAYEPAQTINYASVHDDLNLYDKITYAGGGSLSPGIDRIAFALVATAQGIPLLAEGDEFLRSKVVNGDYSTAMNSYQAGDNVNAIHWGDKITNASTVSFYEAAIALRKATPSLRLTTWNAVNSEVSTRVDGSAVIVTINGDTVVVANPGSAAYQVSLPAGTWTKSLDTSAGASTAGARTVAVFKKS
jgi:pullulanase